MFIQDLRSTGAFSFSSTTDLSLDSLKMLMSSLLPSHSFSANGTYVNGVKLGKGKQLLLKDGDEISLVSPNANYASKNPKLASSKRDDRLKAFTVAVQVEVDILLVGPLCTVDFISFIFKDSGETKKLEKIPDAKEEVKHDLGRRTTEDHHCLL